MEFQWLGLIKSEIWSLHQWSLKVWYILRKFSYSSLVLLGVIWIGKVYALIELQRAGAYEKRDIGLTRKLNMWYFLSIVVHSDLVC